MNSAEAAAEADVKEGEEINARGVIDAAKEYLTRLFAGNSGGHDAAHTLRVYRNAMCIADGMPGCDRLTVALAALLHDADDGKLFRTENFANARTFLEKEGIGAEQTEKICSVIGEVSFSKNRGKEPSSPESMIVRDADRLDAMGAVGVARTFAYGGEHGRSLDESAAHFREKLLLLKDEMCTEAGRAAAGERHRFLAVFLREYLKETEEGQGPEENEI